MIDNSILYETKYNVKLYRFANKKAYVTIHGILGTFYVASFAYTTGILTTLEKRYRLSSNEIAFTTVGGVLAAMVMSPLIGHFLSKKHKPRMVGLAGAVYAVSYFLTGMLHFIYQPGNDATELTVEYATLNQSTMDSIGDQSLCQKNCELLNNN